MKPEVKKITTPLPVALPSLAKMNEAMLFNARVDVIGAYGHNIDEAPEIKY